MIRTDDLHVRIGGFHLRGVSLAVETGQYAVLIGPTGSGKTVLLETLAGLNRAERGSVWLDGADVTRLSPERRGIGFVYQRSHLFPHLSVRENVAYGLRYHGLRGHEAVERVEQMAGLLHVGQLLDRRVDGLSGGETQKVALARALAIRPRVLLLDEPLEALDPLSKEALVHELRELHRETGTTILHVTHDQGTARALGQAIGVLREGRLLQFGPKVEVFERPTSAFVARFVGTENVFLGRASSDGPHARIELGCGSVLAETSVRGAVGVCIRPERITCTRAGNGEGPAAASGERENRVVGTVEAVSDRGALVRYEVATASERFIVLQAKREYASSGCPVGEPVALRFPAAAVHVFPRRGGGDRE